MFQFPTWSHDSIFNKRFSVHPYAHFIVEDCIFDVENDNPGHYNDDKVILGHPGTTDHFVKIHIGAFFTTTRCKFNNAMEPIRVDYKANSVIIEHCIFYNVITHWDGFDQSKGCIVISDDESKHLRMLILKELHYPEDLTADTFVVTLICEHNIFASIHQKYPFMESLYYDISNQDFFFL